MTPPTLPDYDALPVDDAGTPHAWHLFGADDQVGLVNLQTAERIAAAATLVRTGAVFRLDAPVDFLSPALFGRGEVRHRVVARSDVEFDDWIDSYYLQVSSQWDSLGHVGARPGVFYNGASADEVVQGHRNTIQHWAKRGIVGRGIVLDVAAALTDEGRAFSPGEPYPITVADLELARDRAGVTYEPGDVVMVRTGFMPWYAALDEAARSALADMGDPPTAGLEISETLARYVWNTHASALACDNPSVEVRGAVLRDDHPADYLHHTFIGRFGLALGELWWLEALAADCAGDGIYEAFVTSSPLVLDGGIGSPANAMAVK
jgi:kynurenine formamidase